MEKYVCTVCGYVYDPAENEHGRERHDLRHQKRQQKPRAVQPQRLPVCCRHINDRIHTINVEEKRQQEYKDLFLLYQLRESPPQTLKTVSHHMLPCFRKVSLPVGPQERHG